MRVKDAAKFLDVSPGTVYALVSSGKLKCCRIGMGRGVIRITEEHIADYLREAGGFIPAPAPPPAQPKPSLRHLRQP